MISYLGFPLMFPDGTPFGTICILDNKPNSYSSIYEELIASMQSVIQSQLALIYVNTELGDKNRELKDFLEEIKALRNILPICAHCKKIRDDKGFWNSVETYFFNRLGTEFSHGICPECVKKNFPDFANDIQNK
jgi:hypothetical protein